MTRALALVLTLALTGCATSPDARIAYQRYLDSVDAQHAAAQVRVAAIARMTEACQGDARCVETVAGYAALAALGGAQHATTAAPPQREPTPVEQAAMLVGAVSPIAQAGIGYYSQRQATRAQVETTRVMWAGLAGIVDSTAGAMADVSRGAIDGMRDVSSAAIPSITVGGDYVTGTQIRGDFTGGDRWAVGRDFTGRDRFDVGGDYAGRDNIGGDRVGRDQFRGPYVGRDQNIGDRAGGDLIRGNRNRLNSPDIDESGNCRNGADCSIRPDNRIIGNNSPNSGNGRP